MHCFFRVWGLICFVVQISLKCKLSSVILMEGDWPEEITNCSGWEEEFLGVHCLRMPAADMEVMNPIDNN